MPPGGRHDQGIRLRVGVARLLPLHDKPPPGEEHRLVHVQDPVAEPSPRAVPQPRLQLGTEGRIGDPLDPENDLGDCHPAQVARDGRDTPSPCRHGAAAARALPQLRDAGRVGAPELRLGPAWEGSLDRLLTLART